MDRTGPLRTPAAMALDQPRLPMLQSCPAYIHAGSESPESLVTSQRLVTRATPAVSRLD